MACNSSGPRNLKWQIKKRILNKMGGFYTYMANMDFMNSIKRESFSYCIFILNSLIISDTFAKRGVKFTCFNWLLQWVEGLFYQKTIYSFVKLKVSPRRYEVDFYNTCCLIFFWIAWSFSWQNWQRLFSPFFLVCPLKNCPRSK